MIKRSRTMVALAVASSLVVAACGGDDDAADPVEEETETTEAETDTETTEAETETTEAETETTEAETETTEAESDVESLLIWADENRVEAMKAIAPAFTEATGVEVQVELVAGGEMRDQVSQAAPAGEGPDIFVGAHDWTGELAASGVISPIDISAIQDSFLPVALEGFNFEGQNYAVPYATEAIAMYRNTDLAPDAPATWEELTAACDAAAAANCLVVPGGGDGTDAYHNYPFGVSSQGGYIFAFDESTGFDASQVGLDSPEGLASAEFLEAQVAAGYISSTNYDDAKNAWLEGNSVFWVTGPWELANVRDQTGVANWDVSVIPQMGAAPAQPFVGAQGFYLSAFSENPLIAQSFLLDFVATDDTMQALYEADPRGTAWVAVQEGLAADPQASAFGESALNGIPMPNIPQMGSVWGPLGDNLLLVRNGELGADEAMTTAAESVRAAVAG